MMNKLKKHMTWGLSTVFLFQLLVLGGLWDTGMDAMAAVSGPIPAAYWKLDEAGGLTAYDASGGNQNGTLVNHATWTNVVINN